MTLLKLLAAYRACIFLILLALVTAPLQALAQASAFEDPSSGAAGAGVGSQELSPIKAEIDGGDIAQGQSAQVIVMMRNNSSTPLTLQKIDLVPSSNVTATVVGNQCDKEPIKPGIECPVTIAVKGELSGKYRVGILANHSGRTKVSNLAILGNVGSGAAGSVGGMPSNELESFPNVIDFGNAKRSTPFVRSIAIRNTSTKTIEIKQIDLAASPLTGFAVSAPECKILAPSGTCAATVTWTPTSEGKAEGAIVMNHTGPSSTMQIALSAEYTPAKTEKAERFPSPVPGRGLVVADRESVEFGTDIDGAASITVSLVNAGDKAVTLRQVRLAGSDNGLSLSSDDCASQKVLEPNDGCALTVNWLPRRVGPVIDDIQVIHDGARGVLVLPVRGSAKEVVTLNMPIMSGSSMPRIATGDIDEKILGDVSKDGSKQTQSSGSASGSGYSDFSLSGDSSALNGYRVTSLSSDRAVIAGPRGRIIVQDGQPQIIAGGHWIPRVMADGVELIGDRDSVVLLFDRSLGIISANGAAITFATAPAMVDMGLGASSSTDTVDTATATTPAPTGTLGGGVTTP